MEEGKNIYSVLRSQWDSLNSTELLKRKDDAVVWFRKHIDEYYHGSIRTAITETLNNARFRKVRFYPEWGKMYSFFYKPKTTQELPYYDEFPLVFIIEAKDDDSFLGLNLHYLPYKQRLILFEALEDLRVSNRAATYKDTRLLLNYQTLKKTTRYHGYKECIRRYLTNNLRSNLIRIEDKDWLTALFLPTDRFVKASKQRVWSESRKSMLQP